MIAAVRFVLLLLTLSLTLASCDAPRGDDTMAVDLHVDLTIVDEAAPAVCGCASVGGRCDNTCDGACGAGCEQLTCDARAFDCDGDPSDGCECVESDCLQNAHCAGGACAGLKMPNGTVCATTSCANPVGECVDGTCVCPP